MRAQVSDSFDFGFVAALLGLFTHFMNEAILYQNGQTKQLIDYLILDSIINIDEKLSNIFVTLGLFSITPFNILFHDFNELIWVDLTDRYLSAPSNVSTVNVYLEIKCASKASTDQPWNCRAMP